MFRITGLILATLMGCSAAGSFAADGDTADRVQANTAAGRVNRELVRKATMPLQPSSGPGGADYTYQEISSAKFGSGNTEYWLYEPKPMPASAPVIVFMHGWGAMDPAPYSNWIIHLVKRGNVVIYPRYQASRFTAPGTFNDNAIRAIRAAIETLNSAGHVKPDSEKFAILGHSCGGVIAANVTVLAAENGLPKFKALLCLEPGGGQDTYEDFRRIPADTLMLCIVGEDDAVVTDVAAKRIFARSTQVPAENKDFITVHSDNHGTPKLLAGHFAPLASRSSVNTLDWYGFWKWTDALTSAAFTGDFRDYALGNTPEQRSMGDWSDGQQVTPATVTDTP
jgi:dienelactone hydrolase